MSTDPPVLKLQEKQMNKTDLRNSSVPIFRIAGTDLFTGIYYKVKMPKFPEGFVIYTEATDKDDAHFIQIDLNPKNLPHYEQTAKWEKDAQWMFRPTEDPDWYQWDNRVSLNNY